MKIIGLGDDVSAGMDYIGGELASGRTGVWVGRGPAGFALLVGSQQTRDVGLGKVIGVSWTPAQLRQLQARIGELLKGTEPQRIEIDGLNLGGTPKGD